MCYHDEGLVEDLKFEQVAERFYSDRFKFITGTIKLKNLIANQQRILQNKAFIAVISG